MAMKRMERRVLWPTHVPRADSHTASFKFHTVSFTLMEVDNVVVKKCLLMVLAVAILTAFLAYSLFKHAENGMFKSVDLISFCWSGQNEGETIAIESTGSNWTEMATPPFYRFSLARGIEGAAKRLHNVPLIPTLLPEGIRYADVYVGPNVTITQPKTSALPM